jgi:hypothetical protein
MFGHIFPADGESLRPGDRLAEVLASYRLSQEIGRSPL